jgi:hypothetical protein
MSSSDVFTLRQIHAGTPKYTPEFAAKVKELEKNQVHEGRQKGRIAS